LTFGQNTLKEKVAQLTPKGVKVDFGKYGKHFVNKRMLMKISRFLQNNSLILKENIE